jgi:hypothetical protein
MHCRACDTLLSDFESTRRNANTFEFVDLCNSCFKEVKHIIPVIERKDLITEEDIDDDLDTEGEPEYYIDFKDYIVHRNFNED